MVLIKLLPWILNPWQMFWGLMWNIIEIYRIDFMSFAGPWMLSQIMGKGKRIK
jgi:hypothetical protein